jgi:hypothetical protein
MVTACGVSLLVLIVHYYTRRDDSTDDGVESLNKLPVLVRPLSWSARRIVTFHAGEDDLFESMRVLQRTRAWSSW